MFDPHYQSYRMDQAPDFAYLEAKWRSGDSGDPAGPVASEDGLGSAEES
jgi:hypothetical protein